MDLVMKEVIKILRLVVGISFVTWGTMILIIVIRVMGLYLFQFFPDLM
jgi:hypothetical protein